MKTWFRSSPTPFMVSRKLQHRVGITAAKGRHWRPSTRANIACWVGLEGTWSPLRLLLFSSDSSSGFGWISAALVWWLQWVGAGQQKGGHWGWLGGSWAVSSKTPETPKCFHWRYLDTYTSFYSGFWWQKKMFSCKVKVKTKLGENQPQMFLPHGNETFRYCQNKTRKLKHSVLILPSQNQHISFKMFWFQSDCIFLWRKKKNQQHLSEMFSTGSSVEFITRIL